MKKHLILLILTITAISAHAQQPSTENKSTGPEMASCKVQIAQFCKAEADQKDVREILKCLVKNDDHLSTECKQEIQRFVQAGRQTTPPGGGPFGALGSLAGLGTQVFSISYEGRHVFAPEADSKTPSLTEHNLNFSIPVYKGEKDTVALTLTGQQLHLSSSVTLDSGFNVPTDFYRTEVGAQYSRKLEDQKTIGVRGTFGYTGDKFSHNTESFHLSANYSFPGSKSSYWVLMIMMSNNNIWGTMVPIPGFFYIYRTPTFTGLFGIPILSMQWTPANPWSFSFSALGPILKTEIAYGAIDNWQLFSALGWRQQKYILDQSINDRERLTVDEKNFEIGLRKPLLPGIFSEIQAGYLFDRCIYLGEGFFNKDSGNVNLDSSWYIKGSLKLAF